jgi:cytochrome d ubiquinol oxidase subunit I
VLAFLSTHDFNGCVEGINDLNNLYTTTKFPQFADQVDGNFAPILWVTYWSFRWMMGFGLLATVVAVAGLWVTRKNAKRPVAGGCGRSRSGRRRSRCSASSSAGSSPRWAVSPGSCSV